MTLHWYRVPTGSANDVDTLAAQLAPFGVVLRPAGTLRCIVYRDAETDAIVKEVGEKYLLRSGECRAVPRQDATASDVLLLLRSAGLAVRQKPSRATGWWARRTKRNGAYWQATVLREVDDGEAEAAAFRSAQCIEIREDHHLLDPADA